MTNPCLDMRFSFLSMDVAEADEFLFPGATQTCYKNMLNTAKFIHSHFIILYRLISESTPLSLTILLL